MMEILNFAFQSFWHFLGIVILINSVLLGIAQIFRAIGSVLDP